MTAGTILVLDDDTDVVELVKLTLSSEGHVVHTCTDAAAALDLVDEVQPTVLIVDLMLPKMDGEEFLMELRRRRPQQEIPLILLSASSARERVAERLQVAESLGKPFSPTDLLQTVNELVDQAG